MRVTVLGCYGGSPRAGGACSGYLVEDGDTSLLLDCGSGVISNIQKYYELNNLENILVSHFHDDHISDLGIAIYNRLVRMKLNETDRKLKIYTPYCEGYKLDENVCEQYVIDDKTRLKFGDIEVTFYLMKHPKECYGMRLDCKGKSLFYTSDTAYFEELVNHAKGVDVLISECSLYGDYDGSVMGHMNAMQVGRLASSLNVRKLIYTHLPIYGDTTKLGEEIRAFYNGQIYTAFEGLRVEI